MPELFHGNRIEIVANLSADENSQAPN